MVLKEQLFNHLTKPNNPWTTKISGFDLDVEVGMSENEWSDTVNPTVMQFLEDGESLGLITLSGYHTATGGASIHFKIENKCLWVLFMRHPRASKK